MQNFRRSLSFLWPYRVRIAISLMCVVAIAVLWGGGLGLFAPGAKIFFSQEGLHGWTHISAAKDRLDANFFLRMPASGTYIAWGVSPR